MPDKPLVTQCPNCWKKLKLKSEMQIGRKVPCPKCSEKFIVNLIGQAGISKPTTGAGQHRDSTSDPPSSNSSDGEEIYSGDEYSYEYSDDDYGYEYEDEYSETEAAEPEEEYQPAHRRPKKKRKKSKSGGREPSRWMDADGELSLGTHRLLMVGTGMLGGMLGTAVWYGVIAWSGYEVGYVAILVGFLVGSGVRLGASKWDFGWGPALTAAAIALASIGGGKVLAYQALVAGFQEDIREAFIPAVNEESIISRFAGEIEEEMEARGEVVPERDDIAEDLSDDDEGIDFERLYSPIVWAKAEERWRALSEAEQKQELKQLEEVFGSLASEFQAGTSRVAIFGPLDLLWVFFAVSGAFKIAAGMEDDDD